jgi:hypothetical protein
MAGANGLAAVPPSPRDETPSQYILRSMATCGIKIAPKKALNGDSSVRCIALRYRTEEELPAMYDQQLLQLLYDGSPSEVTTAANARQPPRRGRTPRHRATTAG